MQDQNPSPDNDSQTACLGVPDVTTWVDLYGDYLFGIARYRADQVHLAEEFVQETFLRALADLEKFSGRSKFKYWLRGILTNVINSYFRSQVRQKAFEERAGADLAIEQPSNGLSDQDEIWETLESCLAKLPNRSQSIFRMKELDELSQKEIAAETGLTESNISVILTRARRFLRKCVSDVMSYTRRLGR